jgi:radical SAM protein with 4Fe4S-binding SPASM domain
MGILEFGSDHSVPRLDFELSTGCDHSCGHCYNVWNADDDDPQGGYRRGQLRGPEFLAMVEKAITESGADHVTITGGEPLLHRHALEIIELCCELTSTVQLITNGSHVTPEVVERLGAAGVRSVQLTLLSAEPHRHNLLKGADCFDDTVRAALDLRRGGVGVQVCFVAMRQNWQEFPEVIELCHVLGVRQISYNRMSPTGGAVHEIARLLPEVAHVEANLDTAEELGRRYGIAVATAMPIPPCLIRLQRYEWVSFGFCSTGTESPNLTVDPLGNVRSCNLSSHLLGNIVEQPWAEIGRKIKKYQKKFRKNVPEICRGCRYERSCQGGCKESAFATFGDTAHPEPFLHMATEPGWREEVGVEVDGRDAAELDCPGSQMGRGAAG